jgi:preprotein translocase subunit SecB
MDAISQQPQIVCKSVFVTEAIFRLKSIVSSDELNGEYDLKYEFGYRSPNERSLENFIYIQCTNKKHPEAVEIALRVVGQFEGDPDDLKRFVQNCFGIIMPYARNYLAMLTKWGPMNSIMLPIMNVSMGALNKQLDSGNESPN